MKSITPEELHRKVQGDGQVDLIDVRTPLEFREIHVEFARNVPLDQLDPEGLMQQRNGSSGKPLYLICQKGQRGSKARQKFVDAGFENVINVEGGTEACAETDLPMTRGEKVMSLERQVRVAAGTLIVVGSILGFLVHPGFHGLSAFIGAGLVFAGLTDTCAMGMLIAKMPWNQVGDAAGKTAESCDANAGDAAACEPDSNKND